MMEEEKRLKERVEELEKTSLARIKELEGKVRAFQRENVEIKEENAELKERIRMRESGQNHQIDILETRLAKKDQELAALTAVTFRSHSLSLSHFSFPHAFRRYFIRARRLLWIVTHTKGWHLCS